MGGGGAPKPKPRLARCAGGGGCHGWRQHRCCCTYNGRDTRQSCDCCCQVKGTQPIAQGGCIPGWTAFVLLPSQLAPCVALPQPSAGPCCLMPPLPAAPPRRHCGFLRSTACHVPAWQPACAGDRGAAAAPACPAVVNSPRSCSRVTCSPSACIPTHEHSPSTCDLRRLLVLQPCRREPCGVLVLHTPVLLPFCRRERVAVVTVRRATPGIFRTDQPCWVFCSRGAHRADLRRASNSKQRPPSLPSP